MKYWDRLMDISKHARDPAPQVLNPRTHLPIPARPSWRLVWGARLARTAWIRRQFLKGLSSAQVAASAWLLAHGAADQTAGLVVGLGALATWLFELGISWLSARAGARDAAVSELLDPHQKLFPSALVGQSQPHQSIMFPPPPADRARGRTDSDSLPPELRAMRAQYGVPVSPVGARSASSAPNAANEWPAEASAFPYGGPGDYYPEGAPDRPSPAAASGPSSPASVRPLGVVGEQIVALGRPGAAADSPAVVRGVLMGEVEGYAIIRPAGSPPLLVAFEHYEFFTKP